MKEKTLNRMRRSELIVLLQDTMDKINEIERKHGEIVTIHKDALEAGNFVGAAQQANDNMKAIESKIKEYEKEIFDGDGDSQSIKEKINTLVKKFQDNSKKLEKAKHEMLGYTTENDEGEDVEYVGYIDKIKENINRFEKKHTDMLQENEEKHTDLYKKIETELSSGATSVSLSKDFNEKVRQYQFSRRMWQGGLVLLLLLMIGYFGFVNSPLELNGKEMLLYFFRHAPIFSFSAWLVVFMGNRRAENLKLEEAYKHKELMAKTFTGYKKSIEELSSEDKDLLIKHMTNLLDAVSKDSSNFLSTKGENHPFMNVGDRSKSKPPVVDD